MVRTAGKKSFIDKKNSTTYNLIYRASEVPVDGEEDAEPERQLVDARLGIGIGRVDDDAVSSATNNQEGFRFGPNHPLAWLQVCSPPSPSVTSGDAFMRVFLPIWINGTVSTGFRVKPHT